MTGYRRPGTVRRFTLALMLLCCATPGILSAATVPEFEAHYRIKRAGLTLGTTRLSFRHTADGRYAYDSISTVSGLLSWLREEHVSESSSGSMDSNAIRPDEYRFQRTGDRGMRNATVSFDWRSSTAVNTVNGSSWKMDIQPGTLDKLVVQIAIMQRLQAGVTNLDFSVADGGKPKHYSIVIHGEESVEVPAGEFTAVRIEQRAENMRRKTFLWAAPALDYLPVKILREENSGATYYSVLESVTINGKER
jgi:hypothetical protein